MVDIWLKKKMFEKKTQTIHFWGSSFLNMQFFLIFVSSFEHVNFAIDGKCFKTIMTIQIMMLPLWFFKHTKMQFEGVSTHLGGSFDYFLPSMVFVRMVRMFLCGEMKFQILKHHLWTNPRWFHNGQGFIPFCNDENQTLMNCSYIGSYFL